MHNLTCNCNKCTIMKNAEIEAKRKGGDGPWWCGNPEKSGDGPWWC